MSEPSGMTDEELHAAAQVLAAEQERRRAEAEKTLRLQRVEAEIDDLLLEHQHLRGEAAGGPWVLPVSAVHAYPRGAVKTHRGKTWESLLSANVWEPGVSGWRLAAELDENGEEIPAPFNTPSGAHDAYQASERITWTDGDIYAATRDGVVHSPAEAPGDWLLIEPEPELVDTDPGPFDPDTDQPDPGTDEPEPEDGEPETPALTEWAPGDTYTAGDQLTYQGTAYTVVQGHTAQAHWTPDQVGSLYQEVDS